MSIQETIRHLFPYDNENYVFIYTPPKVGSTTLVTSLRISLGKSYSIIHIHDEIMLRVLTGIKNVTVNEIIHYLGEQGKNVYVIDVYRTSIERKMSEFFEKIAPYHFNNSEANISNYSIKRISDRFNKLFPHLGLGDHTFDKYKLSYNPSFDFHKKYTLQVVNGIKYIKLRLCDSSQWNRILSDIFRMDIVLIQDYETEKKEIGDLYQTFKREYKLPCNYYDMMKNCNYFHFYYSEKERNDYLEKWKHRLSPPFTPYTETEYQFYVTLYLENQYINDIQTEHYIDNGCFCKLCSVQRKQLFIKAKKGEKITEKIIHTQNANNQIEHKHKLLLSIVKRKINEKRIESKFKPNQFSIVHQLK
jgi:hypothetical protein